jgi:hypothetical protein
MSYQYSLHTRIFRFLLRKKNVPNFDCSIFSFVCIFFNEEVLTGTTVICGAIFSFPAFRLFRLITGLAIMLLQKNH